MEDWDESTLQSLIRNQLQEGIHLDYKRSPALDNTEPNKNEISRDVSSFANSDGGIIIYGMEETGHVPTRIDGGIPVEGKREWLEQVINSRIHPKIDGLRIRQIDLTSNPGHAVFVIQIPIGFTAHQAHDLRYYRRHNFQTIPMHDYEVKMVMNRFKEPNLRLNFEIGEKKEDSIMLIVHAKNVGKTTAPAAHFRLLIPPKLSSHTEGIEWKKADRTLFYAGNVVEMLYFNWGGPTKLPFFPELMLSLSAPSIRDKIWIKPLSSYGTIVSWPIYYEIYATDMKPKKGKALLHVSAIGRLSIEQGEFSFQKNV